MDFIRLRCTESNCTKLADYFVWFAGYGQAYTARCKHHLIWLITNTSEEIETIRSVESIKRELAIDEAYKD